MNGQQIESKAAAYLNTFLEKEGYVLLKTEYVKEDGVFYLRAYIDLTEKERALREEKEKEKSETAVTEETEEAAAEKYDDEADGHQEGVGINDCAKVSRRLSKWLDKEDFITDEYTLEVCSKGYLN